MLDENTYPLTTQNSTVPQLVFGNEYQFHHTLYNAYNDLLKGTKVRPY